MPLYNEADGIADTLVELDSELHKVGVSIVYVVQNDCSTDKSIEALEGVRHRIHGSLDLESNCKNLRHGPTTRRAYERAILTSPDVVIQLDSDGQFVATDISKMLKTFLLDPSIDSLIGARTERTDPWFRKIVTLCVRVLFKLRFRVNSLDPNSPIRIIRPEQLKEALVAIPQDVLTPNILLTLYFHRRGRVIYVPTVHRVRRGNHATGTMWDSSKKLIFVPRSLLRFCISAARQLLQVHKRL